jgi:hypothetical protein
LTKVFKRILMVGLLAGVVLGIASQTANAAVVTFNLTSDHCTGGCLTGQSSGGTITITDVAGGVSVDVTLANGNKFVSTGFQTDFGFNLTGTPVITYSLVTSGFAPTGGSPQSAGSLMMDGTGTFQYGVDCTACGNGGSNPQAGPLDFTITATGLTTNSFVQNGAGQFFAVDMLSGTTGKTGAVDASAKNVPTPEPNVLFGLGLGLVSLGLAGRRYFLG